jgi:hypothetical protein
LATHKGEKKMKKLSVLLMIIMMSVPSSVLSMDKLAYNAVRMVAPFWLMVKVAARECERGYYNCDDYGNCCKITHLGPEGWVSMLGVALIFPLAYCWTRCTENNDHNA